MTTPADPQTNERKFRFKDEWLVALVGTMPGVTPELIKRWRFQEKPYVAQALIDGDVLSFKEIAEVVKEAFRIDYVDLNPNEIDKNAAQILPEKLCREAQRAARKSRQSHGLARDGQPARPGSDPARELGDEPGGDAAFLPARTARTSWCRRPFAPTP